MSDFKYRPDVDGLRALAVVLVLVFHTGLGFSGGFIGVDVFFVISGFLITGLILKEQETGKFSLSNFWARRIGRILPAATVMVVGVLIAGFFLLLPDDYLDLAKSTIAQQLMLSNVYFWRNTGYFDNQADLMPLLHTWSLAVEEQFYLGYPFLLVLLHRLGRKTTIMSLAILGIGSFAMSVYGVHDNPKATFFLLHTRAWELLMGGLICFLPKPTRIPAWLSGLASAISLGAILGAGWLYTSTTPFPGLLALVPCLATATLIYSNSLRLSFPASALATKPFVFVGLISYSLYLWHWPVLAYYRYWNDAELSLIEATFLLACSGLAAVLSWRFVETPMRRSLKINRRKLFGLAGVVGCVIVSCSGVIVMSQGLEWRVSPDAARYAKAARSRQFIHDVEITHAVIGEFPYLGDVRAADACILWGDSHAMALCPGLSAACKELNVRGRQATHSATPPLLDFVFHSKHGLNDKAPEFNSAVVTFIREKRVPVVFLAGFWASYAEHPEFEEKLKTTIREITSSGAYAAVILDVAEHEVDVPRHFARKAFWGAPNNYLGVSIDLHRQRNRNAEQIIRAVCDDDVKAFVLDPAPLFTGAQGIWQASIDGDLMNRDTHHLSIEGGLRLKPLFFEFLCREVDTGSSTASPKAQEPYGPSE